MAQVYADPKEVSVPKSGGSAKFRLKNPLKEKFIAQLLLSDPNEYYLEIPPFIEVPMGENLQIEVFRMKEATSTGPATVRLRINKFLPKFPDFDPSELTRLHEIDVKVNLK